MKFNWKVLVACVVIVAISYWAIDSLRIRSYNGGNLNVGVGSGPVTVTNASSAPILVQLVSAGSRTFNVASETEGLAGTSARQGTGGTSSQLYEFTLPTGVTVFNVTRGTNVSFVASDSNPLEVAVQPTSDNERRTTVIVTIIVILASLYFISWATQHRWLAMLRGKAVPPPVVPSAESASGGQGRAIKSYGDNSP
jgi:hypothetical protein